MRRLLCVMLGLAIALPVWAKSGNKSKSHLPKDPQALLAAAAPYYDYSSPDLKPWHLKATYQLYDESGKPTEQGIYEYWWASPKVYRSTWTRKSASDTNWHTADGKLFLKRSGERLTYFERQIPVLLFRPVPIENSVDLMRFSLEGREEKLGGAQSRCVMSVPKSFEKHSSFPARTGEFDTFCFDPKIPALQHAYIDGVLMEKFSRFVQVQGRFLPLSIDVGGYRKLLFAMNVLQATAISQHAPALTPAADARVVPPISATSDVHIATGALLKQVLPVYPPQAYVQRLQGKVVLAGTIGVDGRVKNLEVVASPERSMTQAAESAVRQWLYKPYLLDGQPVKVQTTINVIFSLGR